MTTDFRALCVELTDCLEKADWPHKQKHVFEQWIYIARKALAEPETEGPTPHPADGEVAELVRKLREQAAAYNAYPGHEPLIEEWARCFTRAADLLERLSPPQPVPVSERLPGAEDCDAEGRCWIHMPDIATAPSWRLVDPRDIGPYHTHWLPAHALPTPTIESE